MSVFKPCKAKGCESSPRCEHPWWFDFMHEGRRHRMPADDFVLPRLAHEGREPLPIKSKTELKAEWEPRFKAEIIAGRDPRLAPAKRSAPPGTLTVASFLQRYVEDYVEPKKLRSLASIRSRVKVLTRYLGQLPVTALERPDEINEFKTESDYAEEVEVASVHRCLELLRTAINWGRAQTPPLLSQSPFHKFGVTLNKAEASRDRRIHATEEKALLDTALNLMNTGEHQFVGPLLHDRIIGALELCCRRGEMLLIQNRRVDWDTHQIGIPGASAKDQENRRIPFDPDARLAQILKRRQKLGPWAYVFGTENGEFQPNIQTAWETLRLLANGFEPRRGAEGTLWNRARLADIDLRWHDLRHEGACRLLADGLDLRIIQLMLGHASVQQTQRYLNVTDEELRRALQAGWHKKKERLRLVAESA